MLQLLLLKGFSQKENDTVKLTLQQIVQMAKDKSIASQQAVTSRETHYWEWRTYQSNYKPQLSLNGILPGYQKSYIQVVQPNGTIEFQPVHNNNSSLNLSFSQSIAATGGTIYGTSQLQRFDDFDRKNTLYNSMPYAVGYSQPLFQFNSLKWDKQIEPLKYNESKQAFAEDMEQIAVNAGSYFFDLLLAQVNLKAAETNLTNTQKILLIANEKYDLGKISRNEILQLQLELLKSEKAAGTAKRDMEIATLNIKAYTGMQGNDKIELIVPEGTIDMQLSTGKVLEEAYTNRSDAIAFVRKIAEAKREVAKAKANSGINASLIANLGFSKSASTVTKVYRSPQDQQLVQLQFDIPVLDWGRQKSRTKTAEANLKLTAYSVEQDKQNFTQEIVTQVTLFEMMKDQVKLAASADSIATEKYGIAKDRYVLGNLSITDLGIAFEEKDQAKRDYVAALRDLWSAYYELRYLSLYDFEKNEKIMYK